MDYRVEKKYLCSERQLQLLQGRLAAVMPWDAHQAGEDRYTIRSVYFDNYANSILRDSVSGVDRQSKFRIRTYGFRGDVIRMEIKSKLNGYCHKDSCSITREQFWQIMEGVVPAFGRDCPKVYNRFCLEMATHMLRPVVIVEYERTAFVNPEGNVRVTFDRNIGHSRDFQDFFDPRLFITPALPSGQHILEVKYDAFLPDYIGQLLDLGSLEQCSFSKYYIARQHEL